MKRSNQPIRLDRDLKFNPSLNHGFLTYLDEISEQNSPGNSLTSRIIPIKANGNLTQPKHSRLMELLIFDLSSAASCSHPIGSIDLATELGCW